MTARLSGEHQIRAPHKRNKNRSSHLGIHKNNKTTKKPPTPKHHFKRRARTCSVLKRSSSGCISTFGEGYNCREEVRETRHHPKKPNKLPLGSCQETDPILSDQYAMCFLPPILFGLTTPNKIKPGKVGLSLLVFLT